MNRKLYSIICALVFLPPVARGAGAGNILSEWRNAHQVTDTLDHENALDAATLDSLIQNMNRLAAHRDVPDSVDVKTMKLNPFISTAQYVKGFVNGIHVQESSGEPGSLKNMVWRGLSGPLYSNKDLNGVQPTVFVNGIPLAQENNFAFDIQRYNFRKIGAETDLFTRVDMNAVKSIEVIKDPIRLAELGPLAANGAIWIVTHSGRSGERRLSINSYYGFGTKPEVTPVNAEYEHLFRQPFYALYGSPDDRLKYPGYLADSTNANYYGPSNWQDLYYRDNPLYAVDMSLTGGSDRANFSFYGGHKNNAGVADGTNIKTYNALFSVNMAPFAWFTVSAFVDANRSERQRNRSLRDQFSETAYLPELTTPLSPNKEAYAYYLDQHSTRTLNDNVTNNIHGYLNFKFKVVDNLSFDSKLSIDYTEGLRDVFWPSTLMEGSNFVSNYFGYTQRLIFSNGLKYLLPLDKVQSLDFGLGSEYVMDLYRFNYAKAYDGPNDFVKINVVNGNSSDADFLQPRGGLNVSRWNNKDQFRMQSFIGNLRYSHSNIYRAEVLLRMDGSSTVQRDSRWIFTPAVHFRYNAKEDLWPGSQTLSALTFDLGAARIARPISRSKFSAGPQYASNMGWSTEPGLVSYNGFAGISRPYGSGWVGYGIDWAYSDQLNISLASSWFADQMSANVSLYQKDDRNQLALIPIPSEYGYVGQHKNGMDVRNRGVELGVGGDILPKGNGLQWRSDMNLTANKNTLKALPNGLDELVVGDRKLKIGHSVDRFWLYQNDGIYNNVSEIPTSGGRRLAFEGIFLNAGDPKWRDTNGDLNIDDQDRVLMGQASPKIFGAWNNRLAYRNFDLNFQFYFATGHKLLNSRAATRYDFINNESNNTIQSVREIFHWQQDIDISKYPIYNPWSSVVSYRVEQDLFLEDASFVKLRTLSLGYELSGLGGIMNRLKSLHRAYVYVSGTNLHTWTGFSGSDPELTEFNGYYTGYGLPLAPTYTLGIKLDL